MSAIEEADAIMAAAHPPPLNGATPHETEVIAEESAKHASEKPHPELLANPTAASAAAAEVLKEEGNRLFAACKFVAARDAYTKAIDLNPKMPAYFTNRAFTELKLEELEDKRAHSHIEREHNRMDPDASPARCSVIIELTVPALLLRSCFQGTDPRCSMPTAPWSWIVHS